MTISAIVRTAIVSLRRDSGALALSFILPVVFFSIFAVIFGGHRDSTPKIKVIVVDEDRSRASQRLVQGLKQESSLVVKSRPEPVKGVEQPEFTATTAEVAVKEGTAPVAVIIPHGLGENPIAFGPPDANRPTIQLLEDSSDMVAPHMIAGLLQKVAMTSMPDLMAEQGSRYFDQFTGGLTKEQRDRLERRNPPTTRAARQRRGHVRLRRRRNCCGHGARRCWRKQEQPDGFVLCRRNRSDVPALYGQWRGRRLARRSRKRDARPRA